MSLHTYLASPDFLQSEPAYRLELERRLRALVEKQVPVVLSLKHLSMLTGVSFDFLRRVVERRAKSTYRTFKLRKRSGGYRWICIPSRQLLRVQRWIHRNILCSKGALARLSGLSTAYAPQSGILGNASRHCSARMLVKVDVEGFFDSISERQVYRVFRDLGYPSLLSFELARLSTRVVERSRLGPPPPFARTRWRSTSKTGVPYSFAFVGHLPQGGPTSPMLANLVCVRLDAHLTELAETFGATATRYADDIVFSLSACDKALGVTLARRISEALALCGLSANRKKTSIVPAGARRIVTGLVVDGSHPSLTREFVASVEVPLHCIEKFGLLEHCRRRGIGSPVSFVRYFDGVLRFAQYVSPSRGANWRARFRRALASDGSGALAGRMALDRIE